MATECDMNMNTADIALGFVVDTVRAAFCAWLSGDLGRSVDANSVILGLDAASEQLQKRRIVSCSIWEITKASAFVDVYNKARDNKLFRVLDKKNYSVFKRDGQLYFKFLKTKPNLKLNAATPENQTREQDASSLTIKEAVLKVLSEEARPMTAEEIYDMIIEQKLYVFGAQNPISVVRNIIESACDNSTYSEQYRAAVPRFHFEKNSEGKRIYTVLNTTEPLVLEHQGAVPNEVQVQRSSNLMIWGYKVEQEFQKWLEREKYAQRTADNYRRAAAQIFRNYLKLAQKAVDASENELDAIRKYVTFLNEDSSFVDANATRHNQFTAALAALERFYSTTINTAGDKNSGKREKQPEETSISSSSLGNIVDLEEGKIGIRKILEAHFQTLYGYSNINILFEAALNELPMFMNDNAIVSPAEMWQFMTRVFGSEYTLSNPHIWQANPSYSKNVRGLVVNLAIQYGGMVNREQIDRYFSRIRINSPTNAVVIAQGELLFCDQGRFLPTESIILNPERSAALTKALTTLFENENTLYIVPRDIRMDWFAGLPKLPSLIPWTPLLLQEVLRVRHDIGFRFIMPDVKGQDYDTLGAAIVPEKSELSKFADVVHLYCAEKFKLPHSMTAEDLRIELRNACMLEGNELIYNMHKALIDYRFAFNLENTKLRILES